LTDNILETVRERLRREMNNVTDDVATGGDLSAGDVGLIAVGYANRVGIIEGLARAERTILDVLGETEQREEEDT
jgi:hypothetical protein